MKNGANLRRCRIGMLLAIWSVSIFLTPVELHASTLGKKSFKCPVDGVEFEYTIAMSGTSWGKRLDLRPTGPIVSPWPIPQCPECGFILYKTEFTEKELQTLKAYVLSDDYRRIDRANVPYYFLASLKRMMGGDSADIGYTLLMASWQAEDSRDETRMFTYLEAGLQEFILYLAEAAKDDETTVTVQILAGEIERRLGLFERAKERFAGLGTSVAGSNVVVNRIIRYELELIEATDVLPHMIPSK